MLWLRFLWPKKLFTLLLVFLQLHGCILHLHDSNLHKTLKRYNILNVDKILFTLGSPNQRCTKFSICSRVPAVLKSLIVLEIARIRIKCLCQYRFLWQKYIQITLTTFRQQKGHNKNHI